MSIEKLIEFATTGDKNTDELDLDRGFPSRIYPARQWFNWLFNSLTVKINEIIDNKVDKTAISELSGDEANEGIKTDSKLISAKVLKDAITTHAPKPEDATIEVKGIVRIAKNDEVRSGADVVAATTPKQVFDMSFGYGYTTKDVKSSRVSGITYINTDQTVRMIQASSTRSSSDGGYIVVTLNGVEKIKSLNGDSNTNAGTFVAFMVNPGEEYKIEFLNCSILSWSEYAKV